MSNLGVPVRLYALVENETGEILASESGLPAEMFVAGKDFKTNLADCLSAKCGLQGGDVQLAAISREHGAAEKSCMAVAFWVSGSAGTVNDGYSWVSRHALSQKIAGFEAALVENCFRSRPAVWVQ